MSIGPWEELHYTIRKAHLLGPTRGATVHIFGPLVDERKMPPRGVLDLYATRIFEPSLDGIFTPDGKHPIYAIDTMPHGERSFRHKVYWLPWSHNETVGLNTLDDSNADMFLTSGFSGCHFVSCDGVLLHTAAGYAVAAQSTLPVAEAFNFDRRGGSPAAPRAIVMGWRPRQTKHWFFAYEDINAARKDYDIWKPLRG
jgi:hypothetical protein